MSLKGIEQYLRRRYLERRDRPFTGELVTAPRKALVLPADARILFLRQDRIGDVLVAVPVIRAIRRHYPDAQLHLLLSRNNWSARHAMLPWVDRLWRYDKTPRDAIRLLLGFRRAHYDAVVDLIDNPSVTSSLIVRGAGSRYAIGILKENASVYSHCVPLLDRSRVHIVERIAQLLLPFGIDPAAEPLDLAYPVTEAEAIAARSRLRPSAKTLRFGINISGSSPTKEWGMDNFVSFLRWLEQCYPELDPTVCGAPDQAAQVEAIVAATGAGSVGPLTSFHEFAAVVHEFDLLLTPDTSIVHLAAAWKTPTVALYHQWNPDVMPWYPYRTRHRALCDRDAVGRIPLAAVQEAFASLMTECFPTLPAQDRRRPSGP